MKNAVAEEWFKAAGKSLQEVQEQINFRNEAGIVSRCRRMQSGRLTVSIETTRATVNNVLAYLPGKTDEYVIIGAHYDHLGRGNFDSLAPSQIGQIHPGADDNASGTAGVLELARLLAPQQGQLRRGILFMSFAGEELGLLGSAEWVKEPTRPLDKAVAMLNMDMIGRIKDDKVYIGGVGTGSTSQSGAWNRRRRKLRIQDRIFAGRIFVERPHFVRRQEDSRAVFLLRIALGLSQAVGHMGEDQSAFGGAIA